ncbi:MAG TPA: hypothetical protein DD738_12615 [Ruminiclostridium sp.]|nr:hypothetical protein [Ruminiclostridium sp.]
MKIQIREKSYEIPWEYIVAPSLILLTIVILILSNRPTTKEIYYEDSGQPAAAATVRAAGSETGGALDIKSAPSAEEENNKQGLEKTNEVAGKININTATMEELMALPYIGEVKARAIIDYRNENGPFDSVDDLLEVKGIGTKTLEKLKPLVALE